MKKFGDPWLKLTERSKETEGYFVPSVCRVEVGETNYKGITGLKAYSNSETVSSNVFHPERPVEACNMKTLIGRLFVSEEIERRVVQQ